MNNKIITFFCLILLVGCQNNDIEVLNGSDTSTEKMQGKWIVVNYWADWCAPCIKEIPELVEFAEENTDILVYAFNFDELDSEDLAPIAKKFKVDIPSLISHPREIWGIETPPAVPATFFINPQGVLVKSFFRPQTKDSLNEILDRLQKSA
jgi:thiol-disulfide isomerase/thioredoxin|tara:strand:- start:70 stop:522 length:453 start_codon:yes stop_codon:yes gene_type:complete